MLLRDNVIFWQVSHVKPSIPDHVTPHLVHCLAMSEPRMSNNSQFAAEVCTEVHLAFYNLLAPTDKVVSSMCFAANCYCGSP